MLRDANPKDAPALAEIYNHYILNNDCTFETEALSPAEMGARVLALQAQGDPWLVLEEAGQVLGYAYAHPFRERQAYYYSCEGSVYCRQAALSRGLGELLLEALIARLRQDGRYYLLIAVISGNNQASIRLCEKTGFAFAGRLPKVGRKNGKWLDTVNYYLQLQDPDKIND